MIERVKLWNHERVDEWTGVVEVVPSTCSSGESGC